MKHKFRWITYAPRQFIFQTVKYQTNQQTISMSTIQLFKFLLQYKALIHIDRHHTQLINFSTPFPPFPQYKRKQTAPANSPPPPPVQSNRARKKSTNLPLLSNRPNSAQIAAYRVENKSAPAVAAASTRKPLEPRVLISWFSTARTKYWLAGRKSAQAPTP